MSLISARSVDGSRVLPRSRRLWRVGLLGAEHRVGQRDRADFARAGVLQQIGVDKKDDAHVAALARRQLLRGKAEALQLVEVDAAFCRRNVVGGGPGGLVGAAVSGSEPDSALP